MESLNDLLRRTRTAWVWVLRIAVGSVFIASGMSKSIDIWGTVYKIEEYLQLWGWHQPRTIVTMASMALCGGEFVLGCLLMTGSYRRTAVWLLTALMAFMLPLSLWIWVDDPVADCGCFGDMLVISNRATFWKNVAITLGLICLWRSNRKVAGIVSPYLQWAIGAVLTLYIVALGIIGYNIQPLIDFRRFPDGTSLSETDSEDTSDEDEATYTFIYENDKGERAEFHTDNLPDSTWTFVDRKLTGGDETVADGFVILDEGEDITPYVISDKGEQLLVVVPEILRVNPSHTYAINTLSRYITERGGTMTALLSSDRLGIDYWMDISMAEYPVYTAEPTLLKELVRGNVGVVYLVDGRIVWKRALSSIDTDMFDKPDQTTSLREETPPGAGFLGHLTLALLIVAGGIVFIDRTGFAIHWLWARKNKKGRETASRE